LIKKFSTIRIPRGITKLPVSISYLNPRFTTLLRGGTIEWINDDDENHTIVTDQLGQQTDMFNTGSIRPNERTTTTINTTADRIDYTCSLHPQESGTIIILDKDFDEMSNSELLRFHSNAFNIKPPKPWAHLDSDKRKVRETVIKDLYPNNGKLIKFFDPHIFEILLNAEENQLQNRILAIVYWDLSGFSTLCITLKEDPLAIIDLLRSYFDMANKIIHKHNGIIDKFLGDGILAYFGYYYEDQSKKANDAFQAALELREKFKEVRLKWLKKVNPDLFNKDKYTVQVKCGIHIGSVLFGLIETEFRNQITIVGPNSNFASRLEGVAEQSQIVISKEMFEVTDSKNHKHYEKKVPIQSYGDVVIHIFDEDQ
jgi:class 3 adenylate cyclase